MGSTDVQAKWGPNIERGTGNESPSRNSLIDSCSQKKTKTVFSNGISGGVQTILKARLPAQQTQNKLSGIFKDVLSHNVLFGHIFTLPIFCLSILVTNFAFLRNLCECLCVSMCVCATLAFSLLTIFVFCMVCQSFCICLSAVWRERERRHVWVGW